MSGIEPAVYIGFTAICAIMAIGWRVLKVMKEQVEDGVKPVREGLKAAEERIKKAEEEHTDFRLRVAQTYTTKEDVYNANKPVLDSVERLTNSVDKMGIRIDRVIEQSNAAKPASRRRVAD